MEQERTPATGARNALGRLGEQLAAEHLQRLGFDVLARNVRTRSGEIDLIVHREGVLVFVEVKTLRSTRCSKRSDSRPLAWLKPPQQRRLRRLAGSWLSQSEKRPRASVIRFDAIGVIVDQRGRLLSLEHIEGAW